MNPQNEKIIIVAAIVTLSISAAVFIFTSNPSPTKPSSPVVKPPVQATTTTLFLAGDIMLSRDVRGKILQSNNSSLPFLNTLNDTREADIAFANLESPFSNQPRVSEDPISFKADPDFVSGLVNAGFDILSTANNHAFDQDQAGVDYTAKHLEESGIKPLGTLSNCHDGVVMEANGIKFGFLGYSYAAHNDGGVVSEPSVCSWNNMTEISRDITRLKPQVDFLIVSSHFGAEYQRKPSAEDSQTARNIIELGADMFIGHHPHWVQTIEEYKGRYIFYSLGNFVFDQMWSQDTKEGLTLKATFKDKRLDKVELKPVVIESYCCPRFASEQETKNILTKINPNYISNMLIEGGKTTPSWTTALSQNFQVRIP